MRTKRTKRTKGIVRHNKRVRFCSLDYYKYCCTDEQSSIEGIHNYKCDAYTVTIHYENGYVKVYDVSDGDTQLKQVIKIINAYLGGSGDGAQ